MAPVERHLSGDFFCAPFGLADVECAPPHGWTANSGWSVTQQTATTLTMTLDRKVLGATISKTLRLSDTAPILYQTHIMDGGEGSLTAAHHPMVRIKGRASLSTSPKRACISPATPLETGRNALACPARSADLRQFPCSKGGRIDLTELPIAQGCEDFITLIEGENSTLGWTALVREEEDDILFFLKDARVLPVTMLWHSNGGRDHAPWNGAHTGVIGIEDGCAAGSSGHRAALEDNPIAREGVATALPLGGRIFIRHAIGALSCPTEWRRIAKIELLDDHLLLTDDGSEELPIPFDSSHFTENP